MSGAGPQSACGVCRSAQLSVRIYCGTHRRTPPAHGWPALARQPQPRPALANRTAVNVSASAADAPTSSSDNSRSTTAPTAPPSFTQLYLGLAGALAPGGGVQAAPTPLGRGLVATQQVPPGATLLSVDWANLLCVTDQPAHGNAFGRRVLDDWQLLHGRLPPLLVRYLLAGEGDWFLRLAAWLLWLKHNAAGPFRLYVDLLPKEEDMTCLMNYTEAELADFQSPALQARARHERQQISALHDRLFSSAGGELTVLKLAHRLEDTIWAACMVNSRCFSDAIAGETVSMMVPCADMANHVLAPNTSYQFVAEQDAFQLRALQGIDAGVEACISYGCTHKSNEELMRDYGFVIAGNLNDRVPFITGDDVASHLAARAAAGSGGGGASWRRPSLSAPRLLAAVGLAAPAGSSSGGGGGGFDLTAAGAAALGGSESDTQQRRLLASVLSLQPFLRDVAAAAGAAAAPLSEAELQQERQSVAALQQQCRQLAAAMPTSKEADEALLLADADASSSSGATGAAAPLGVRRRQAVAARLESKRLLQAADSALQHYADALS